MLTAGVANAANPGQVPDATLASFGLGGMQQMTDAQGMNVRGMGFVAVIGGISTTAGGASDGFGYVAVSDPKRGSAQVTTSVSSLSIGGSVVSTTTTGRHDSSTTVLTVSGAYAAGSANIYAK
jgi:hypothetical protein